MTNNITYEHKDLYDIMTDKTPPNIPNYRELAFPTPPGVEMELVGISKQELARLKAIEENAIKTAFKPALTWEELKEKAQKIGYKLEKCNNAPSEALTKDILRTNITFFEDGAIEYNSEYIIVKHRTPEQMWQIMDALKEKNDE